MIKHDVEKLIRIHKRVLSCNESGTLLDVVLQNAFELCKVKHLKQHYFFFLHW
jgi:hypothetical protein